MKTKNIGRNDPCPCGSGKKYKQCCQDKKTTNSIAAKNRQLESVHDLFKQALKAQANNDIAKSILLYEKILKINPKHIQTLNNLGLLYIKSDIDRSKQLLTKAVTLQPTAQSYANLSIVSSDTEAVEYLNEAIKLNPGDDTYYNNLATIFLRNQRYEQAIIFSKKALLLNKKNIIAINNIGHAYGKRGDYHKACFFFKSAIALEPSSINSYIIFLFYLSFDQTAFPDIYLKAAANLDQLLQQQAKPFTSWQNIDNQSKKLRIGFVSRDLGIHPVGFFLESLLKELFLITELELFAYSLRATYLEDELTEQLKGNFHHWTVINSLSAEQSAHKIHEDCINILIDLAGYTDHSGINIFTWRPAPIQISWLGYFASTGLSCMDYFIADTIGVPQDKLSFFKEKVCFLPDSRLCFSPPSNNIAPAVNDLPALKNGYITFGCFQTLSKLNDSMIKLWSKILQKCPNSKIIFKNSQMSDEQTRLDFIQRLESFGILNTQVSLELQESRAKYFTSYHHVDFMLDTYPFPGGTTTCEALWMGVPTLTLTGSTLLQRQGHSIIHSVGLDNWVCWNEQEYITKAVGFATDLKYLSELRLVLRNQALNSPLMDAKRFAKNFSNLLFDIWANHLKN